MIKCPQCGADVYTTQESCGVCGAPAEHKTGSSPYLKFAGVLILLASGAIAWKVVLQEVSDYRQGPELSEEQIEAQQRAERITRQFSGINGSHRDLARQIQGSMHDPDSFEHVSTVYVDLGDSLLVTMIYRGSNAFGATVTEAVTATVSISGAILQTERL